MINLIITLAGLLLVLGGLYAMTLGFATPPSMVIFIGGLIAFVLGAIMMVLFAGKIRSGSKSKSEKPVQKEQKPYKKPIKKPVKPKSVESGSVEDVKKPVKPKSVESGSVEPVKPKSVESGSVESVKPKSVESGSVESVKPKSVESGSVGDVKKPVKSVEPVKPKSVESGSVGEIKPKRTRRIFKSKEPNKGAVPKPKTEQQNGSAVAKGPTNLFSKLKEKSQSSSPKNTNVSSTVATATAAGTVAVGAKKSKRPNPKRKIPNPKKRSATPRPNGPKSKDTGDNTYVAKRLNMLKQEYIDGIGDVENFIDEKIGSLNETDVASSNLTPKTTVPGGSNLIWSFESFDVQDSLKDTLIKSKSRLVMMYPWIRNIDVGILKKFMDTNSRLIIQEAGLDDDASVELIKLLLDNGVEIRTMPHIHTVAAVSDEDEGLIISTDPIYDSFEVGVKYTDPESIKQINNLFEEAWKLSNPIEL